MIYVEDVNDLFQRQGLHHHLFAYDVQGFNSGIPSNIPQILAVVEECISDVSSWCATKCLQLNATKMEILWFGSVANLREISPGSKVISIGQNVIEPVTVVSFMTLVC